MKNQKKIMSGIMIVILLSVVSLGMLCFLEDRDAKKPSNSNVVGVVKLTVVLEDKSGYEKGRYIIPVTVTEYPKSKMKMRDISVSSALDELTNELTIISNGVSTKIKINTNDKSLEVKIVETEIIWKRSRVSRFFEGVWKWLWASKFMTEEKIVEGLYIRTSTRGDYTI